MLEIKDLNILRVWERNVKLGHLYLSKDNDS